MSVKERILAIKLIEMQEKNPEYTKRLGVDVKMENKSDAQVEDALGKE